MILQGKTLSSLSAANFLTGFVKSKVCAFSRLCGMRLITDL